MVEALREELSPDASLRIVDPGCGSGALVRRLAKAFPRSIVTGLELSVLPFYQAVFLKKLSPIKNAIFKREDFFAYDYTQADVVVMFLPLPILEKLAPLLKKQMKSGSYVVSNVFEMPEGWSLHRSVSSEKILKRNIYIYKIS